MLMTTARDIMTPDAECVGENDDLVTAARRMRELDVGSLPICGEDGKLHGMLTDRDIVVKAIAEGMDPATTRAGTLGDGKPITIGADDDLDEAVRTMKKYHVRRLPVIDGHKLVGMVSQGDIARSLPPEKVGDLLEEISS
jgi:CBS domain-containing protein